MSKLVWNPIAPEQGLALVKELVYLQLPHLYICVTSRPEFDIRANFTPLAHQQTSTNYENGRKENIVDYMKSVVYFNSETMTTRKRLSRRSPRRLTVCKDTSLTHLCLLILEFRFRVVFCLLDTLRQCFPSSVRYTVEELPQSLDKTYERIVMDIKLIPIEFDTAATMPKLNTGCQ